MRQSGERGSVLGFVIVGAVMAILAIGGVYALSRYHASLGDQPANAANQASDDGTTDMNHESASSSSDTSSSDNATDQQSTDSSDASSQETGQSATSNENATTTDTDSNAASSSTTTALPQTGPRETFMTTLGLMLIAGSLVAYIRSRRQSATR